MPILWRSVRNHLTHIKIMFFYLVKDASGWMSDIVSKSINQAIISQSWRVEDPHHVVCSDFPLTILRIDTKLGLVGVCKEVSEACLIAKVKAYGSQKKGGSK